MTRQAMAIANDQTLSEMIDSARQRLVYMAPGMSKAVSNALARSFQRMQDDCITIILDIDPEICRLGYGEMEAVEQLDRVVREHGGMLLRQSGVRIGLLIADGDTMVYAPTPQLIEATPHADQMKQNAIRIGIPPADLERDLGTGWDGVAEQRIGLDAATPSSIKEAKKELELNPPQRFDVSRTVRVFNAQFEFVELSLTGAALDRKRIQIPESVLGLSKTKDGPNVSLRLAMQLDDMKQFAPMVRLGRVKNAVLKRFCKQLPGYGHIVLRRDKEQLMALSILSAMCMARSKRLNPCSSSLDIAVTGRTLMAGVWCL